MLDERKNTHYSQSMARRLDLDEDQIVAEYEAGQSAYGIAKKLGASHSAVLYRLGKLGIEKRSSAEQIRMRTEREANHVEIVSPLREILEGLLLSDGSLSLSKSGKTASLRMEQRPDRREWLRFLQAEGQRLGLQLCVDQVLHRPSYIGERRLPGGKYLALRSLNYVELADQRRRWYPNGKKQVPLDLVLTPTTLLHWFCGDGKGGDAKGTLGLCTDSFSQRDVEFLIERLKEDLDISATKLRQGTTSRGRPRWQILVGQLDAAYRVQELIKREIPSCFAYKLRHVRPRATSGRGRKLSDHDIKLVKNLPRTSLSKAVEAAAQQQVHISKTSVWRIWNQK